MTPLEAARLGDQIGHTSAMKGLLVGLAVGFLVTGRSCSPAPRRSPPAGSRRSSSAARSSRAPPAAGSRACGSARRWTPIPKGPISTSSPNTFLGTGMRPAARATLDKVDCDDHDDKLIAQGSTNVYINQAPAARRTDLTKCSGKIREGAAGRLLWRPDRHVPGYRRRGPRLAGDHAPVGRVDRRRRRHGRRRFHSGYRRGPGRTGSSLALGWAGGKVGGLIGSYFGATGEAIGEVAGGFIGSIVGGGLGARWGNAGLARLPGSTRPQITARMNVARSTWPNRRTTGRGATPLRMWQRRGRGSATR